MRWCFYSPGLRSLHVLSGDTQSSGGAEAQIAYLAASLTQIGHEVSLIYGKGDASGETQIISGVTCIDATPSWHRPGSFRVFWKTLDMLAPDQIYARLPDDFLWMLGLYARRRQGAHFLYALANDLHCSPGSAYAYKRWLHGPLYLLGLLSAHAIATQHDHQRTMLSWPLPGGRSLVSIPNLLRSIADRPRDFDATLYDATWVAQIRPNKQLGRFLDLAAAHPKLRFAAAGGFDRTLGADERAELERRLGNAKNVTFLGPLRSEDVKTLISQSRVLVNTSRAEGFPNTMLEAWGLGVPVASLTIDPGGVIKAERMGLVSETDGRLQRDVSRLVSDKELNGEMGRNGLTYVGRRHSLSAVCDALAQALPKSQLSAAPQQSYGSSVREA